MRLHTTLAALPSTGGPGGKALANLAVKDFQVAIPSFPHWGPGNRGVWPKGEYGTGPLRADQFSILDT